MDLLRVVLWVDVSLDEVDESREVLAESILEFAVHLTDIDVLTPVKVLHHYRKEIDCEPFLIYDRAIRYLGAFS